MDYNLYNNWNRNMQNINLRLPVKCVSVNQGWGYNYVDFYQKLEMKGHNGIDFNAKNSCPIYASHDGVIYYCGTDNTGGIEVDIWNKDNLFKTIYYHLDHYIVSQGQQVKAGDLIAYADNTGLYTTGSHLHFGLKLTNQDGSTLTANRNNGYNGAIDPSPYFTQEYDGTVISNKDWDKCRAYHRYFRGRPKGGYINELKVIPYMTKRLKRLPKAEEINACVYGGWDIEAVINPAMYPLWSQIKKSEYLAGEKPFN